MLITNKEKILQLFSKTQGFQETEFFIVRNDGIVICSNVKKEREVIIGALSSAAWMASEALVDNIEISESKLRYSFDSTDTGIYVLPLNKDKHKMIFCSIYKNVKNPGLLKKQLRQVKKEIENLIDTVEVQNQDSYLFNNITDEEINKLFAGAEN